MISARLEWKPKNLWIGIYWCKRTSSWASYALDYPFAQIKPLESDTVDVWVCVVPCLPIHIRWESESRPHIVGEMKDDD